LLRGSFVPPDILVIGGGPAGLATAIAAAQKGLRVTVVESRKPPIHKPCGEGLLPQAIDALRDLGVRLHASLGHPFNGFRFVDDSYSVCAQIPQGCGLGVRRTVLHRLLIDRAEECGVDLRWGARVSNLESRSACVDGEVLRFRYLTGADGQNSLVRRFARLGARWTIERRFGFRRHYAVAPWTNFIEVHWAHRSQMVVTPTASDEICVSLFVDDPHIRIDRALREFPEVANRLRGSEPRSTEAGSMLAFRRARGVVRGNVALVGDAGCTVDAVSGQGVSLAFRQAALLAEALAAGNLAPYQAAHNHLTLAAMRMTRLLLVMNSSVWLRRKALRLFARRPNLFADMISIHTQPSPETLPANKIASLTWRVLWA
jgi:2-polyprenyl-6-methoxyphenol hydroxylase-like FAD-dependent oxidoreductase